VWLRVIGALLAALSTFLASVWKVARQLFHETTGALFVGFAIVGAAGIWREWKRGAEAWVIGVTAAFTLMMAAFAVASFRSARKVR
jgi:hypothetical protein